MDSRIGGHIALGLRLLLAGTLLLAGWGKLSDVRRGWSHQDRATVSRVLLPMMEIYLSGVLLLGWRTWLGASFATLFLLLATVYLLTAGRGDACHCFGVAHATPWPVALARNTLLLGLALGLLWLTWPQDPAALSPPWGAGAGEIFVVAGLGLVWVIAITLLHGGWSLAMAALCASHTPSATGKSRRTGWRGAAFFLPRPGPPCSGWGS